MSCVKSRGVADEADSLLEFEEDVSAEDSLKEGGGSRYKAEEHNIAS